MQCPSCGTSNPPVADTCSHCGAALSVPLDAERRLVTVLFADLVDHTEMANRVDPEDWQGLLRVYFAEMSRPIGRYGGTVEKFIGDAIFAAFGAPQAYGNDAERAVRAAVEMRAGLRRLHPEFERVVGTPPAIRIGVATGEAVAPRAPKDDQLVIGALTTLAERLQGRAPPDGIVLSDRTHRLVAAVVDADPLGELTLKGFTDAQSAYLLRSLKPVMSRRISGPLVGREREVRDLVDACERLLAGEGQVMSITGEAGLGKSRLVVELVSRLGDAVGIAQVWCQEFAQATAYAALGQLLRSYFGFSEIDAPDAARRALHRGLEQVLGTALSDVRQSLEHLLAPRFASDFETRARVQDPSEVRQFIARAVRTFWEAVAATRPQVLVIEDLQWMDAASGAMLGELAALTRRAPLLLVCTFRPEPQSAVTGLREAIVRALPPRYLEIHLEPLSRPEGERLAGALLQMLGLPATLSGVVAQRAEGNPFYIEEVTQSLLQQSPSTLVAPRLPDTLQELLQARLDGVPLEARRVLQAASVIGRAFPLRLLEVLTGAPDDLASHLGLLQRTGFLHEDGQALEGLYTFRHALLQEAAYGSLLRREKRDYHRRLAQALEQEPPSAPQLHAIARHYLQGEVWDKAFEYLVKAGNADRSLSALEDALGQYETAVRLAEQHPERVGDRSLLLAAHLARGEILAFLGRYDDAEQQYERLLASSEPKTVQAQIRRGIGRLYLMRGHLQQAEEEFSRALALFEPGHDLEAEAWTYRDLASIKERQRDYPAALEHAHRALAIAKTHGLRTHLREIYRVLFATHFYGGEIEQAGRHADEALQLALEDNDLVAVAGSRNNLAHFHLFKGNIEAAMRQAQEAVDLASRLGLGVPLVVTQSTLAYILLEQGRWEEAFRVCDAVDAVIRRYGLGVRWLAEVQLERAFATLTREAWADAVQQLEEAETLEQRVGTARNLPRIHRGMAEAYLGLQQFAQAEAHAMRVRQYEQGGNPVETPAALRVLAVVAREKGDLEGALELLRQSRSLLETRPGSAEHARTLLELAKTYAASGRHPDAKEAVEECIRICAALGTSSLMKAAQVVATHLAGGGDHDGL